MTVIADDQLHALASHAGLYSVSIWMPAHRAGSEVRQDPIRLKNLLTEASEQLEAVGLKQAEARDRLEPLSRLLQDREVAQQPCEGLGLFVGDGTPHVVRLPAEVPELVVVAPHFHLKPLFAAPARDRRFYLLELSQNAVNLLRADRTDAETVELPDAPESFKHFLRFDDPERHVEFHSGTAGHQPAEDRPAVYHGQGAAGDERLEKKKLADYCKQIDEAVAKVIRDERAPLLLAATEPIQGIYRHVSSCRQLDRRGLTGNPKDVGREALHKKAVDLLADDFQQTLSAARDRYGAARGAGLADDDLGEVLRAGRLRAVDLLLVRDDESRWGRFDPDSGRMETHDERQAGDEDLLNTAAVLAFQGGADVHAVGSGQMPGDAPVAAAFRFRPEG